MTATRTRSRWNYNDLYDAAVEMVTDDVDVTTDEVEFYRDIPASWPRKDGDR